MTQRHITDVPDVPSDTTILPDQAQDLAAAACDASPVYALAPIQRQYAATQLQQAAALIEDTTPGCEGWNLQQAVVCLRAALRTLAKGAR